MIIKILGGGCSRCKQLENNVLEALEETSIEAKIVKITNPEEIVDCGVMKVPALIINEKIVSFGYVPNIAEIKKRVLTEEKISTEEVL